FRQALPRRTHQLPILFGSRAGRDIYDGVIAVGRDDGAGLSTQPLRRFTSFHGANAPADLLSEHDDPAIRGTQVLERVNSHRPLADLRFVVSGAALTGLMGVCGGGRWRGACCVIGRTRWSR